MEKVKQIVVMVGDIQFNLYKSISC
jgi:hypothetical protein